MGNDQIATSHIRSAADKRGVCRLFVWGVKLHGATHAQSGVIPGTFMICSRGLQSMPADYLQLRNKHAKTTLTALLSANATPRYRAAVRPHMRVRAGERRRGAGQREGPALCRVSPPPSSSLPVVHRLKACLLRSAPRWRRKRAVGSGPARWLLPALPLARHHR